MNGSGVKHAESYAVNYLKSAPPFVGRRQQLSWLTHCLQEALTGHPQVALISGEAGIGKTRLFNEIRSESANQSVQTLYGRCYEDLAIPYLPFVEMLLLQIEKSPEELKEKLSLEIEVINQFFGRYQSPIATSSLPVSAQTNQDKLKLLISVSRLTIALSKIRPVLLIVDDLHWADPSSLDLFGHLVFTVADTAVQESVPMLILGTYRPEEREGHLVRLTARLQREVICQTLDLPGLEEQDIHELIQGMGLQRPSHQLVKTVNDVAHGNPLFTQEIIHHLRQRRALQERNGYIITTSSLADLMLPEHVTGALVARTQRLSEACHHLLTLAACLGDHISFQLLQVTSGMRETEVLDALDEGIRHDLLTSDDEAYQFAHSLIRQVFYSELSTVRRQRLHQQIAQTLERLYADRLNAHTLEIAHHLIRAGSTADMDKVAHYARLAGDQTYALFAWGESARYYETVLSAAHKTQCLSALDRGHLHYAAGLAHYRHMDIGACRDHYDQAIEAYRAAHYIQGLAQVLVEKTRILFSLESIAWGTLIDLQPLEDVFAALGEDDQGLRSSIAAVMAEAYRVGGKLDQAEAFAQQALEIAQRLGDDRLYSRASHVLALAQNQCMKLTEAVENWQHALTYARRTDDLWCRLWPLQRLSLTLMQMAKVDEAESTAMEACHLAQELHDWGNHSLALAALVSIAVTRGKFELAEQRGLEIMPLMNRSRYPWGGARALLTLACARLSRGEWGQAEYALDMLLEPGRVFEETGAVITTWVRVYRQLLPAHTGISADATLEQLEEQVLAGERTDLYNLAPLCALVEIGYLMASPSLVVQPYQRLAQALEHGVVFSSWWIFLIPRILGVAATLNAWWPQAEAHFQTATDIALRVGAKPELGRTYLDYARMLVAHNEMTNRLRALDLVNQAETIFSELGMHAFLLQTRQLADTLRVPSVVHNIPRTAPPLAATDHEAPVWLRIAHERTSFLR